MEIRCIGCGSILQTTDETKKGYVPKINDKNTYCQRCFKLRNYNINTDVLKEDYIDIINTISKEDALIVHVIDLFDFSGTFLSSIKRITGQNDCILIGNKVDLLPKSIKPYKVIRWLRRMGNIEGFKPIDVILASAKKQNNIEEIMQSILLNRKNRNVYFVGCSNVGKSTLINAIIKRYTSETKDVITTSKIPGTTLDMIKISLDGISFYDTPGIFNTSQICHSLSNETLDKIYPKSEIKPIVFQLNEKQTIFISGLASIDFLEGEKTSFVFYFSNELLLHRTKLENSVNLFTNQVTKLLTPPNELEYPNLEYTNQVFTIKDDSKKYDIVISGLGFLTFKGKVKIKVTSIKNTGIYLREAII